MVSLLRQCGRWGVSLLLITALASCGMFSRSDPRTDPAPLTEYDAAISANIAWSVDIGSGSAYSFAPHQVEGTIYAATPSGSVLSVDASSGSVNWRTSTEKRLSAGVGSDGTTTAVATARSEVIAFDRNGKEKWTARATSDVYIPPVVGDDVVVVRSGDYRIQAFDADDGDLLWSVQRPGPALALKTSMGMMLLDGILISGLPNGKFIAIDIYSGMVQWEGSVGSAQGATDLDRISDVVGSPQLQGPLLCGTSYQGQTACFDISQGGDRQWSAKVYSGTGIASDSQQLYLPDRRSDVVALALENGEQRWQQQALRNRQLAAPAVTSEAVAVGDLEGYVHFLSRADGQLLGRLDLGGGAIVSPLLGLEKDVVVQTGNGKLVRVSLN